MSNNLRFNKESYRGAFAVTRDDNNDLTVPVSALYVGTAGTLKVDTVAGDTVTFGAVAAGLLPIAVTKVYLTGTSADNIVGLK
jgi:hypothetical protein